MRRASRLGEPRGRRPGDIVLVEGGDAVTADLRLLASSKVQADESALTGESVPVGKKLAGVAPDAPIHERANMLFKGGARSPSAPPSSRPPSTSPARRRS